MSRETIAIPSDRVKVSDYSIPQKLMSFLPSLLTKKLYAKALLGSTLAPTCVKAQPAPFGLALGR